MISTRVRGAVAAQVVCVFLFLLFVCPVSRADTEGIEDLRTALSGTAGNDTLSNAQPLDVNAILETASDQDVTTSATGIEGLAGDDSITAAANVTPNASSTMNAPYVPFRLGGTTAASSSTGLSGGNGADLLLNLASIFPTALSHATPPRGGLHSLLSASAICFPSLLPAIRNTAVGSRVTINSP